MDIGQTLSNMGRKISEAKLPHIGNGRQYNMPTYDWGYNLVKWNPIFGPATWTSAFVGEVPPILFADNAIDTVANGLPNVYNWAVDEYNAGASKRAANNYFEGAGKRGREQVLKREAEDNVQKAKKLVANELRRMSAAGELTKNISKVQKLIDLYNKIK